MMTSTYLYVGFLALIVAMFGFLTYAVHSSRLSCIRTMAEFVELRKFLERELRVLREGQQEAARDKSAIRPLEKPEIQKRDSELETLRLLILRQDEEIRLLQKDADAVRQSLAGLGGTDGSMEATVAAILKRDQRPMDDQTPKSTALPAGSGPALFAAASTASSGKGRGRANYGPIPGSQISGTSERSVTGPVELVREPGWKENLDGILSMLDAMEREVQN